MLREYHMVLIQGAVTGINTFQHKEKARSEKGRKTGYRETE